jgi:hypothetical protein
VAEIAGSSLEGDRLAAAFAIADAPPPRRPVIDAVLRDADAGMSM